MPRSSIKDEKTYQALRRDGASKEKAARIANEAASTSRHAVGVKGGKSPAYEEWTKPDLLKRARSLEIAGRSTMSKQQLIKAIRSH